MSRQRKRGTLKANRSLEPGLYVYDLFDAEYRGEEKHILFGPIGVNRLAPDGPRSECVVRRANALCQLVGVLEGVAEWDEQRRPIALDWTPLDRTYVARFDTTMRERLHRLPAYPV